MYRALKAVFLAAGFCLWGSLFAAAVPELARAATSACGTSAPRAGESYAVYQARAHRQDCVKPWTVLVYMAADNDLAPYAFWDLYEMEAGYTSGRVAGASSTTRSDLLVQLAAPGQRSAQRLHMFQQQQVAYDGTKTVEDFKQRGLNDVRSPVVATVPRGAVAEIELQEFIKWGINQYPAEHYMVVVWGHGQGWSGGAATDFAGRRFGGLAFSDSSHTFLDIPSLHRALRSASDDLLGGKPIDLYASDACLMQMVEVATEISDSARFISGSSQVENYLGLPYRRMMFELNSGRFAGERESTDVAGSQLAQDEPYLLARILPRLFRASLVPPNGLHSHAQPKALETVTMSSISSDGLRSELLPALGNLGRALQAFLAEDPLRAVDVAQTLQTAPSFMGGSQELGGFLRLLGQVASVAAKNPKTSTTAALNLQSAIAAAADALNRTVVSFSLGTRYTGQEEQLYLLGFRALAVWLPISPDDFSSRIADFSSSEFYRQLGGSWSGWLSAVFGH